MNGTASPLQLCELCRGERHSARDISHQSVTTLHVCFQNTSMQSESTHRGGIMLAVFGLLWMREGEKSQHNVGEGGLFSSIIAQYLSLRDHNQDRYLH